MSMALSLNGVIIDCYICFYSSKSTARFNILYLVFYILCDDQFPLLRFTLLTTNHLSLSKDVSFVA
jgi:hypothetical protein